MRYLLIFLCFSVVLCGCARPYPSAASEPSISPSDHDDDMTVEEVMEILDGFNSIYNEIVSPALAHIKPKYQQPGHDIDEMAIAEYFRDYDFSEELAELERLASLVPAFENGQPREFSMARTDTKGSLEVLRPLIESGQKFREDGMIELTKEFSAYIIVLNLLDVQVEEP